MVVEISVALASVFLLNVILPIYSLRDCLQARAGIHGRVARLGYMIRLKLYKFAYTTNRKSKWYNKSNKNIKNIICVFHMQKWWRCLSKWSKTWMHSSIVPTETSVLFFRLVNLSNVRFSIQSLNSKQIVARDCCKERNGKRCKYHLTRAGYEL